MAERWVVETALVVCDHGGVVPQIAGQGWVRVGGVAAVVEPMPIGRAIGGCPVALPLKPCAVTLTVGDGYSEFIRIGGRRVCLKTLTGLTDGTPPGTVSYSVTLPGQDFVEASA